MENSEDDVLEIIPENEIPESCNLVAKELPETYHTYGFMTTCYNRRKDYPEYDVTFYRLQKRPESGIFVVILRTGNRTFALVLHAFKGYEKLLEDTLINTSKIHWNERPLLQGILPRHYSLVHNVGKSKNFEVELYSESTVQLLPIEEALNFEIIIPDEYCIRPLTSRDIDFIYEQWHHKDIWTIDDILYSIRCHLSFGLFSKETNDIVGWIMFAHYGGLGMLNIRENYRRMGFAKLLVRLMSKELAKIGIVPFAAINAYNAKSLSLFNSLGYYKVTSMRYFRSR